MSPNVTKAVPVTIHLQWNGSGEMVRCGKAFEALSQDISRVGNMMKRNQGSVTQETESDKALRGKKHKRLSKSPAVVKAHDTC